MRPIKGTVTDEAALQAAYKADEARKRALEEGVPGFARVGFRKPEVGEYYLSDADWTTVRCHYGREEIGDRLILEPILGVVESVMRRENFARRVERAENARGLADVWKRARSREELLDAAVEHLLQRLAVDESVPISVQIAAGEAFGILSGIDDEP